MINPYFNQTTFTTEQDLVQDLNDEAIQIYGHNVRYIKREDVNVNRVFGEDDLAQWGPSFEIEMYVKTPHSFGGQSEFISKFGLVIEDTCTFLVSQRRFRAEANTLVERPREGDLIWIEMTPTNRYLFDIRFVEDKEQLFELGKLYTYELRCELFNYSHETFATGNTIVDDVARSEAYTIVIPLGTGSGTYTPQELVFQGGDDVLTADATATVYAFDANTRLLSVQNVIGAFGNSGVIVGVTSHASYTPVETPNPLPTVHDPIADNAVLIHETDDIFAIRGSNPRTSS